MDCEILFKKELFSDENLSFLVELIYQRYIISTNALSKCIPIITNMLSEYLSKINRLPQNENEIIQGIQYLNRKCIDDFAIFLQNKYPNKNIYRKPINNTTTNNTSTNNQQIESIVKIEEIEIISENQAKQLINKKFNCFTPEMFLQHIPFVIHFMENNKRQRNISSVFDQILTETEYEKLIKDNQQQLVESKQRYPLSDPIDTPSYDLENINTDSLIILKERIKQIVIDIENMSKKGDQMMIQKLKNEKHEIIEAVSKYKNSLEKKTLELAVKTDNNKISENPDVDILDLSIDPTTDYRDLKNIAITFKNDRRVKEIRLLNYFLPINQNNISRFNNCLIVREENKVHNIPIIPNKYDIESLLGYLKKEIDFLKFSVSNNLITISHKYSKPFELVTIDDSILPLLGFVQYGNKYCDKVSYTADQSYNLDSNKKIYFTLTGSHLDPQEMICDQKTESNQVFKKCSQGISLKQMILKFSNCFNQCYDFDKMFSICLQITYLSD